ncbi:MAG: ABC transporter substrate-binding protein, partial [Cyanobium sp.]
QGLVLASDRDIWAGHPEKVLTCHEGWAAAHPEALLALCSGLMQAAARCDDSDRRDAMVRVLSQPQWLGSQAAGALNRQFSVEPRPGNAILRFNHFHADRAHLSNPAEGCWILSQLSRWGWCPFPSNRVVLLSQVYRQDLCDRALALAGFAVLPLPRGPLTLADGPRFDQDDPLSYLRQLPGEPSPPVQPVPLSLPGGSAAPASSVPIAR